MPHWWKPLFSFSHMSVHSLQSRVVFGRESAAAPPPKSNDPKTTRDDYHIPMCGRFQFVPKGLSIFSEWGITDPEELGVRDDLLAERYNIAPSQEVAVVLEDEVEGVRRLEGMRWGLVPPWATDGRAASGFINARVETAAEKPTFRGPWKKHRCLVPATGYYEWPNKGGPPTLVSRADGGPLTFAGLWEPGGEGKPASCALLTMESAGELADLHHRMPVMLRASQQAAWLADAGLPFSIGETLPAPYGMEQQVVSKRLNKVREQGVELMTPDPEPPRPPQQKGLFD